MVNAYDRIKRMATLFKKLIGKIHRKFSNLCQIGMDICANIFSFLNNVDS